MFVRKTLALACMIAIAGCAAPNAPSVVSNERIKLPPTPGEEASNYGYVPLDGLAVKQTLTDDTCQQLLGRESLSSGSSIFDVTTKSKADPYVPLLDSLPDISVRFAVASLDAKGGLTFGPAKVSADGGVYRAILDYVNVDEIPVTMMIIAFQDGKPVAFPGRLPPDDMGFTYQATVLPESKSVAVPSPNALLLTVPVYVGVGMRIMADVRANKAGVALTSLGGIAADAESNGLSGTLTVQTIGITGEAIATTLPLPNKLDRTTVENAILAIGSNRIAIYKATANSNGVTTSPRVVGLYSPIGSNPPLINAMYSAISRDRPLWARRCVKSLATVGPAPAAPK